MELDDLQQFREAIAASPQNIPLRKMLASALMKHRRFEEAEVEWKDAIRIAPADADLKIGLANAFLALEKTSLGLVIMEDLCENGQPPGRAWLVYAQLLLQSKKAGQARDAYQNAVAIDPSLSDALLESEINQKAGAGERPEPQRIRLGGHGGSSEEGEEGGDRVIEFERPKISFDHVGGMDGLKNEIRMKIIHPLEHPDLYRAYGKKIGGGILLYGPPGCGKTFIARATAGQINANFISVGLNDILTMWIGESEKNLHRIFQKARQLKPCVLFFDEVDALGASRSDMKQSAGRHLINQFLAEMDGVEYSNEGVLILAATNTPWNVDPAFRRPGRFDRILFVPPPDERGRESILRLKMAGKPAETIDFEKLARSTGEFSGADLEAVVDRAIESRLEEAMLLGRPIPLQTADLSTAIKKHRATTIEWFTSAKNYALFANEGGLYDDILTYLKLKK